MQVIIIELWIISVLVHWKLINEMYIASPMCITLAFVRRLRNLTMMGLGLTTSDSPCFGTVATSFPTRWETSMSSGESGGRIFIRLLQRSESLSSVVPGVSSGMPNTRTDSRRLCCSRASAWSRRSRTSRRSVVISSSLRATVACKVPTACWRSSTVCCRTLVTGSSLLKK